MDNIMLTVGNVIIDENNNKKYRVIAIIKNEITLCEMYTTVFVLIQIDMNTFINLLSNNELNVIKEKDIIFDETKLHPDVKEKYQKKKDMMLDVVKAYGSSYIEKPSDNDGIVYIKKENWKLDIANELKEAGFDVDKNKII